MSLILGPGQPGAIITVGPTGHITVESNLSQSELADLLERTLAGIRAEAAKTLASAHRYGPPDRP